MDGLLLISILRHIRGHLSIIVCSNTRRLRDAVLALHLGADDFIRKPFDNAEFSARIETIFRRTEHQKEAEKEPDQIQIGDLVISRTMLHVTLGDDKLSLTPIEYRLLRTLASEPDKVFSREELAQAIWGYRNISSKRAIDVHILRLRNKLNSVRTSPPQITSVRGSGYMLSSPSARDHTPKATASSNGFVAAGH